MDFNIKSQIRKLSNKINLFTVINEAVVNSIQANSTIITLVLYRNESQPNLLSQLSKINGLDIIDNGEGFTQENINSFSEYGSELKLEIGCKGIGRLCFLKIFDYVSIESSISKNNHKVSVNFTDKFTKSDFVDKVDENIQENNTTIKFRNIRKNHEKDWSISKIKEEVYNHVLPLLYLNRDKEISLKFVDNLTGAEEVITPDDLPTSETVSFNIQELQSDSKENIYFTLHYAFVDSNKTDSVLNDFHCANSRTVCRFKDKGLKIIPLDNYKTTFLLTSDFFDKNVNDERDDFSIYPKETNLAHLLSWEQINQKLKDSIQEILYTKYPDLKDENSKITKSIREENLHLVEYLKEIDALGGLIDSDTIIQKAEDTYLQDKLTFKKDFKKEKLNDFDFINKASNIAGKELIEYITTRDKIISQFEKYSADNIKTERYIHDLILKKGTDGDNLTPVPLEKNHMWLIDDKFMSYSYVASDLTIKTACKKTDNNSDCSLRPDVSVFFRNENNNQNAVIIELKCES